MGSAISIEDSRLNFIPKDQFRALLERNPKFSLKISKLLALQLSNAYDRTAIFTHKHLRGRLAETLLQLHEMYGVPNNTNHISTNLKRSDLAALSNMTTANAIRTLSEFANSGIIDLDGRHITINNIEELKSYSQKA